MLPWKTLSSSLLLDCHPWLRVSAEHVQLPNGVEIPDFYRIEMPEWVQIFVLDDQGVVTMIEHYKHGAGVVSLELPAGYIDPGESPETAARRELREEIGYEARDWRCLGRFFTDGNRGCGATHVFLARGGRRVATPTLEESEIITPRPMTLAEVRAALVGGRIQNMGTIAGVGLALAILEGET